MATRRSRAPAVLDERFATETIVISADARAIALAWRLASDEQSVML